MNLIFNKHGKDFLFSIIFGLLLTCGWAQNYPVSVTDGKGNLVTVKSKPQHIISLGAASTEILFEVGAEAQIAAVTEVSNYPEGAKKLPSAGGFSASSISIETLLSFDPDLVILYSGMHDSLVQPLTKYKIPFYVSDAATVSDVLKDIKAIAELTGYKSAGLKLEKEYSAILKELNKKADKNLPKVYWEVWYEPFMSAGGGSFINDVIRLSGGKNIFEEEVQAYPIVSEESIIASNPKFIFIPGDIFVTKEAVKERRGWTEIDAVKNDRIIIFDADVYTRPGPRIFKGIKDLNQKLYE